MALVVTLTIAGTPAEKAALIAAFLARSAKPASFAGTDEAWVKAQVYEFLDTTLEEDAARHARASAPKIGRG